MCNVLSEQDCLYTTLLRGLNRSGEPTEQRRVITSVTRAINPYNKTAGGWNELVGIIESEHLRFVTSNTTESGIAWKDEQITLDAPPVSFPAMIAALLALRFRKFSSQSGAAGDNNKGLVFLPCELIEANGQHLRQHVLRHAERIESSSSSSSSLGGLCAWISSACVFCNTLVDRIVPGYPREEIGAVQASLGFEDRLVVAGELFHLWVVEGLPASIHHELPFQHCGLEVVFTDDMQPFRTRKVRTLNGAHTACVLAAYLGGVDTVGEMMKHEVFGAFVKQTVFQDILPNFVMQEEEKRAFAEDVLHRFHNPYIRHELLSISLNSTSKWVVRVLPSIRDAVSSSKKPVPPCLALSLAALLLFYRVTKQADGTTFLATRSHPSSSSSSTYVVKDSVERLEVFAQVWGECASSGDVCERLLLNKSLWDGEDLGAVAGLVDAVKASLADVLERGIVAATVATTTGGGGARL